MKRASFNYRNLIAVAVLLALTAVFGISALRTANSAPTSVDSPPVNRAPVGVDLASEERLLGKYLDDLIVYERECRELGRRTRLVSADLDVATRRSNELKGRLSEVQGAFREVVRKLKAANQWDNLNATIAATIIDPNERREFEELNFKQLLDDGANSLTSHGDEISGPLDNLRRKVARLALPSSGDSAFAIVPAAYHPATPPMFLISVKCLVAGAKRGIVGAMGNKSNPHSTDVWSCACHPGIGAKGQGTGAACSECC